MAQEVTLYEKCNVCGGDGVVTTTGSQDGTPQQWESPCTACDGSGFNVWGKMTFDPGLDDIMDKCNDIKEKVDEIKEVVDDL